MFKKIPLYLPALDISRLHGDLANQLLTLGQYFIKDESYLESLVQDKIKFHLPPDFVNFAIFSHNGAPTPHTDGISTSLNYYVSTPIAITAFWEEIVKTEEDVANGVWWPQSKRYTQENLRLIKTFRATTDDAYLLDVSCPHSMIKQDGSEDRVIIRWCWKTASFDNVLNGIEILSPA
jgi:hypothetical protein